MGTREEFDREKLAARHPHFLCQAARLRRGHRSTGGGDRVLAAALGQSEVSSRVIGDMVIGGLKEMDHIAYIRYAIVYLGLDDLQCDPQTKSIVCWKVRAGAAAPKAHGAVLVQGVSTFRYWSGGGRDAGDGEIRGRTNLEQQQPTVRPPLPEALAALI